MTKFVLQISTLNLIKEKKSSALLMRISKEREKFWEGSQAHGKISW